MLATANIEALYENAVLISLDPDIKNNDPNVFIKRYIAPIVFIEKENPIADVLITQKISIDKNTARIYSLEVEEIIPEVSTQGVVRPDPGSQTEGQSLTHRNYPTAVMDKLQVKHEKIKSFLKKNRKKDNFRFSVSPVYTGSAVFYTLEAHDLDIEKINPETESSRGGVVKAALPGRSPATKFSSFFEKFKPVDDLLGLIYKNKYPNIRFSVSGDGTDFNGNERKGTELNGQKLYEDYFAALERGDLQAAEAMVNNLYRICWRQQSKKKTPER